MLIERRRYHSLSGSLTMAQYQASKGYTNLATSSKLTQLPQQDQSKAIITNLQNSLNERSKNRSMTAVKKMTSKIRILTPKNSILKDFFNEQFITTRREKMPNNKPENVKINQQMQSTSSFPDSFLQQTYKTQKNIESKSNSSKIDGTKLPHLFKKGLTSFRSKLLMKSKMSSIHQKQQIVKNIEKKQLPLILPKIQADQNFDIRNGMLEIKQDKIQNRFTRNNYGRVKGLQFTFGEVVSLSNK